ncbi:MAG: biotin/lipoyl-binding protein [Flavobacteriales bacterium]|nr:biotin/lipoyl-binding protein [Flavobacteriales bacterium]
MSLDQDSGWNGQLDGKPFSLDVVKEADGNWHVIRGHRSYRVDLLEAVPADKSFVFLINGQKHTVKVDDRFDQLLHSMGLDAHLAAKVDAVKAPMPGKVLKVQVQEGQEVAEGDALLVLEAMKMENVIKSPATSTVKKIHVEAGATVEKNQLLISF